MTDNTVLEDSILLRSKLTVGLRGHFRLSILVGVCAVSDWDCTTSCIAGNTCLIPKETSITSFPWQCCRKKVCSRADIFAAVPPENLAREHPELHLY
jgi:hypothetical protein